MPETSAALSELSGQFSLADHRPMREIVMELLREGYVPSWCTACYRKVSGLFCCCFCWGEEGKKREKKKRKISSHELKKKNSSNFPQPRFTKPNFRVEPARRS